MVKKGHHRGGAAAPPGVGLKSVFARGVPMILSVHVDAAGAPVHFELPVVARVGEEQQQYSTQQSQRHKGSRGGSGMGSQMGASN